MPARPVPAGTRDVAAPTARPLLAALAKGVESAEERYHALRLLRDLPRWKSEVLPEGTSGGAVVSRLAGDGDRQVQKMVAELLDLPPAVPRRVRRQKPIPGEERRHEIDGTVLLSVPGGEYLLGADDITEATKPVHRVVLSPFWIAKYPVTNEQYERFLRARPKAPRPQYWDDKQFNQPNQPVGGVSRAEALVYCRWAGLTLPSEAQWEAAARGTDGRRYPWGNDEPTAEHANFGGREGGPTPVGAFPRGAGPFGTLDQAGNVWEWCVDVWDEKAYQRRERAKKNPVGTQGGSALRCLRGGSWSSVAWILAAACRHRGGASLRGGFVGFRCVLPSRAEPCLGCLDLVDSGGDTTAGDPGPRERFLDATKGRGDTETELGDTRTGRWDTKHPAGDTTASPVDTSAPRGDTTRGR